MRASDVTGDAARAAAARLRARCRAERTDRVSVWVADLDTVLRALDAARCPARQDGDEPNHPSHGDGCRSVAGEAITEQEQDDDA